MTVFENIEYPFAAAPKLGEAIAIQPGVLWLRMALPMALDHINLYLLEDKTGWWVVDTGLKTNSTRQAWEQVFDSAIDGRPIVGLICTHMHPDHIGMAGWLSDRWRAPLWMTETEFMMGRMWAAAGVAHGPDWEANAFYQRCGMPRAFLDRIRQKPTSGPSQMIEPLPASYHRVSDNDELQIGTRSWRAVVGRGHSPEHLCLFCEPRGLLISGDQVLPRISSNISVMGLEPEGDPLALWLQSIERIRLLPDKTLVLPAHGLPFYGLHARLSALVEHHHAHLDLLEEACVKARRVQDLLPLMFRGELDVLQMGMATGECLAHLNHLLYQRRIERQLDQDGLYTYQTTHPDRVHHVEIEEGLDDGLLMDFEGDPP